MRRRNCWLLIRESARHVVCGFINVRAHRQIVLTSSSLAPYSLSDRGGPPAWSDLLHTYVQLYVSKDDSGGQPGAVV